MRAQGINVISLGAGEPDFDTPEPVRAAAIEEIGGHPGLVLRERAEPVAGMDARLAEPGACRGIICG